MSVEEQLLGRQARKPSFSGLFRATVRRVEAAGLMVTLHRDSGSHLYGPCAWSKPPAPSSEGDPSHTHGMDPGDPPPGTTCFVQRADTQEWVVVAFKGWPA